MTIRVEIVAASVTTELRRAVLRPHWPVGSLMHGDDLSDAVHVAAFEVDVDADSNADAEGSGLNLAIGACVLQRARYPHRDEPDSWQLRGMATDADHRSKGVGAAVLTGAVAAVHERGGRFLWCKARQVAIDFYARNGFVVDSAEYVEPQTGLPHRDMYRRLT